MQNSIFITVENGKESKPLPSWSHHSNKSQTLGSHFYMSGPIFIAYKNRVSIYFTHQAFNISKQKLHIKVSPTVRSPTLIKCVLGSISQISLWCCIGWNPFWSQVTETKFELVETKRQAHLLKTGWIKSCGWTSEQLEPGTQLLFLSNLSLGGSFMSREVWLSPRGRQHSRPWLLDSLTQSSQFSCPTFW